MKAKILDNFKNIRLISKCGLLGLKKETPQEAQEVLSSMLTMNQIRLL